jgi:tyrosinase
VTDLTPFWKTQTTYWVSPDIIDTNQAFNYAYGSTSRAASEMSEQAAEKVFSGEVSGITAHQPPRQNPSGAPESAFDAASDHQASPSTEVSGGGLADSTILEWSARIRCKQFELGGSFSVFVFLGDVPANHRQWLTDPTFAGTFDAFVNDAPDECSNCRDHGDQVIRGFVHLDRTILKRSGRSTLEPRVVVPYLTRSINWGIQKVGIYHKTSIITILTVALDFRRMAR